MTLHLATLLLLSLLALLGLALGAYLLLRVQAAERQIRSRLAAALATHSPRGAEDPMLLRMQKRQNAAAAFGYRLAGFFGFDPAFPDLHPLPWYAILAIALAVATLAGVLLSGIVGEAGWFGVPVLWLVLCRGFYGSRRNRRARRLFNQFPDALGMIVRAVRVGIPVVEGIRLVARESPEPTATEFSRVADQMAIGVPLEEALRIAGARSGLAEYRFFATSLSLQSKAGGGLSETLENLADVIRKRVALRARGYALASEARTSANILGALPIVSGGGLALLNPAYLAQLFTTSGGQKVLATAILMLGGGIFVMRHIIQKALA